MERKQKSSQENLFLFLTLHFLNLFPHMLEQNSLKIGKNSTHINSSIFPFHSDLFSNTNLTWFVSSFLSIFYTIQWTRKQFWTWKSRLVWKLINYEPEFLHFLSHSISLSMPIYREVITLFPFHSGTKNVHKSSNHFNNCSFSIHFIINQSIIRIMLFFRPKTFSEYFFNFNLVLTFLWIV